MEPSGCVPEGLCVNKLLTVLIILMRSWFASLAKDGCENDSESILFVSGYGCFRKLFTSFGRSFYQKKKSSSNVFVLKTKLYYFMLKSYQLSNGERCTFTTEQLFNSPQFKMATTAKGSWQTKNGNSSVNVTNTEIRFGVVVAKMIYFYTLRAH